MCGRKCDVQIHVAIGKCCCGQINGYAGSVFIAQGEKPAGGFAAFGFHMTQGSEQTGRTALIKLQGIPVENKGEETAGNGTAFPWQATAFFRI